MEQQLRHSTANKDFIRNISVVCMMKSLEKRLITTLRLVFYWKQSIILDFYIQTVRQYKNLLGFYSTRCLLSACRFDWAFSNQTFNKTTAAFFSLRKAISLIALQISVIVCEPILTINVKAGCCIAICLFGGRILSIFPLRLDFFTRHRDREIRT